MINSWLPYNKEANQLFFQVLKENGLFKNDHFKRLFSHLLIAEHIWYSRILKKEAGYQVWEVLEERQIVQFFTIIAIELEKVSSIDDSSEVTYINSKGVSFTNKVADILLHVVNHASYHRGQISEALKRLGIQPPETDYIFYKRNKK